MKGYSSRMLRIKFKRLTTKLSTLLVNSYFVSTVVGAPLSIIKEYTKIINALVSAMVVAEKPLNLTSKDVQAIMPSTFGTTKRIKMNFWD
jgi:hypothetical protein